MASSDQDAAGRTSDPFVCKRRTEMLCAIALAQPTVSLEAAEVIRRYQKVLETGRIRWHRKRMLAKRRRDDSADSASPESPVRTAVEER